MLPYLFMYDIAFSNLGTDDIASDVQLVTCAIVYVAWWDKMQHSTADLFRQEESRNLTIVYQNFSRAVAGAISLLIAWMTQCTIWKRRYIHNSRTLIKHPQ